MAELEAVGASFARSGIGLFIADATGRLVWTNDALKQALGAPAGKRLEEIFEGLPQGGGPAPGAAAAEATVRLRSEPLRWFTMLIAPWGEGEPGSRIGVLADCTGRVAGGAVRREREIYLSRAAQDSADAFVSLDDDGRIRQWNDGARQMFGWTDEEVHGRPYDEILVPSEARTAGDLDRIDALMSRDGFVRGHETVRLHREGRLIPVEVTVSRVVDEAGRPAGRSVIYRDISERRRLETELRRTVQELTEANKNIRRNQERLIALEKLSAIGEMSARVAHEIRTPLVTIGGFANTLLRDTPPDSPARRYLEIVREEVRRLEAIVVEILDYVRPPRRDLHHCDVNSLLREAARPHEDTAAGQGVAFDWRLQETLPLVSANRYQMVQVFGNLIQNAVQAMPRGGRLGISTEAGANHVRIAISDTGVGIAEENRREVFRPFFTTKASGSGLGLAIASQIIAQQNGTISFESAEGKGTEFEVRLPIRREASS